LIKLDVTDCAAREDTFFYLHITIYSY